MNIGGLDIGTTGCKLTVYRETGENLSTEYQAYDELESFHKQEVEPGMIHASVIFEAVGIVISKTTEKIPVDGFGVTSFGETFAMLDENDNILMPSLLHVDTRGLEEVQTFVGKEVEKICGVKESCLFSLPKIMWVKKHYPEVYAKTKRILLMQDFVVYMLTGVAQIDYSLACRTMGLDIRKKCWSEEIFAMAEIDSEKMSKPVPIGTVAGKSNLFGLKDATIVTGCIDQLAATIGAGVLDASVAMDGIGTMECVIPILDSVPEGGSYYDGGYAVMPFLGDAYTGCILSFAGGASLKWYRDNFTPGESYSTLNQWVNPDEPTGLMLLPHFSGGATPYMNNASKAALIGMTLDTTKEAIYQAVLEGISYEMCNNMEVAEKNQTPIRRIIATGGGARSRELLQIKANIYNRPVTCLEAEEVGATGAMILTAIAMGIYPSVEEACKVLVKEKETFYPDPVAHEKYQAVYKKYQKLYEAVSPLV